MIFWICKKNFGKKFRCQSEIASVTAILKNRYTPYLGLATKFFSKNFFADSKYHLRGCHPLWDKNQRSFFCNSTKTVFSTTEIHTTETMHGLKINFWKTLNFLYYWNNAWFFPYINRKTFIRRKGTQTNQKKGCMCPVK